MDPIQEALLYEMDAEELAYGDGDGELIDIAMGADPNSFDKEEELNYDVDALVEAYTPKSIF